MAEHRSNLDILNVARQLLSLSWKAEAAIVGGRPAGIYWRAVLDLGEYGFPDLVWNSCNPVVTADEAEEDCKVFFGVVHQLLSRIEIVWVPPLGCRFRPKRQRSVFLPDGGPDLHGPLHLRALTDA